MNKTDTTNINGYIEGYYGRLFNWSDRIRILKKLSNSELNTYFYCPKEDIKHRLEWRKKYSDNWLQSFNKFCLTGDKLGINILIGLSPGLDYQFTKKNDDFNILLKKAKELKDQGAKIVLMFDDIPENLVNELSVKKSEGALHAEVANNLSRALKEDIFVVPRVYSDELINNKYDYLSDFNKTLIETTTIFYCGKKIVSDTSDINELKILRKTSKNKVILWDNLYANDYCPKKIFLGPWFGRKDFQNILLNLTGMIETDLFLIDLVSLNKLCNNKTVNWLNILEQYKVPQHFLKICKYFFPINYTDFKDEFCYSQKIEALDYLLWKWKTPLSREWYQYLLILKQDLQLSNNDLSKERIEKIFPIPLSSFINKK